MGMPPRHPAVTPPTSSQKASTLHMVSVGTLSEYPVTSDEIEDRAWQVLKAHGLASVPVNPVMLSNRLGSGRSNHG